MGQKRLIQRFRALGIPELEGLERLEELPGHFINLDYTLSNGRTVRFWEDDKMYWGGQIHKENSDRCYGLISDGNFLFVCEYGCGGCDAQIVCFQRLPAAVTDE